MIGVTMKCEVEITMFSPKEITNEKDIMQVKENIGDFPQQMCDILYERLNCGENDSIQSEIMSIRYLNPEDVDYGIEVIVEV